MVHSENAPYQSMHPMHLFYTTKNSHLQSVTSQLVCGFLVQPQFMHYARSVCALQARHICDSPI